ncbi:YEATS-associated helix-containing protein [Pleionea sp. CnH1-48]|uniref:YEATS-associated helix-containing protein n=1 Tax=Pleionea sp. CnH1-48 TaxID=2954494 RepID=UPI002097346B|nr:YEATS-associated helix-containing protein [Pleionea sp. CnH1-48]MCO7226042.1 hypothetical protein [Pleionea sp. CnH1-48]
MGIFVWTMLIAGVVGGSVNYVLSKPDKWNGFDWAVAAFVGVVAAFLVPLFLKISDSQLIGNLTKDNPPVEDMLVFIGFCLLASISSRQFIESLSDKVLREVRQAQRKAEEIEGDVKGLESNMKGLEQNVTPVLDTFTEEDSIDETSEAVEVSELGQQVLQALVEHPKFTLRSVNGVKTTLAKLQVDISAQKVHEQLDLLVSLGLAVEIPGKKGIRWSITHRGKQVLS